MFEGKLPKAHEALPLGEAQDDDVLRPLSWSGLVARLAQARELRASLEGAPAVSDASFDAGSARRIAAHHNGKHAVNLDDLGNGKGPEGTAGGAVHGAASGVARN
jgi:hypothetical protein